HLIATARGEIQASLFIDGIVVLANQHAKAPPFACGGFGKAVKTALFLPTLTHIHPPVVFIITEQV
ncbi:MAG: hypothetical protein RSC36_08770, partial [Ruthenibacterium sp.]